MEFRIADTFTDALARLPANEQKAAKNSAFDLQLNPANPGLQFHRIQKSRDSNFWSVRVNADLRIIVHRTPESMLLTYVAHHDKAYDWAERRRIESHPKTGAIQIVEVRERVEEIEPVLPLEPEEAADGGSPPSTATRSPVGRKSPLAISGRPPPARGGGKPDRATASGGGSAEGGGGNPFAGLSREQLLSLGVPDDWVEDVLTASEDSFLAIADHLPAEAAEALLEFAVTGVIPAPRPRVPTKDAYAHPDALRRFRVVENIDELREALEYPWDKWTVYLHPSQREIIERKFSGPARVAGSAGTGKTVVALHRAVRLARDHTGTRVLLTTFSQPLAEMLEKKLATLTRTGTNTPHPERQGRADARGAPPSPSRGEGGAVGNITVTGFHGLAGELYQLAFGRRPQNAPRDIVQSLLAKAAKAEDVAYVSMRFLTAEWDQVIDAWQLNDESAYATVPRLGRRNRMSAKQRARLWPVFASVRAGLAQKKLTTWASVCGDLCRYYLEKPVKPFDHIVIDEAQDLGVAELRLLAAIAPQGADALFFAGDLGQRIFQQPFSWLALGVDVRGRSQTLRVNYRTSHQIRESADRLLPGLLRDVDGNEERRAGTVSVFNGPEPAIGHYATPELEIAAVANWITVAMREGMAASEIAVFVRENTEIDRARGAVNAAGQESIVLSDRSTGANGIAIGTMHHAKGMEYRAVVVMACDAELLPLQARVESAADEAELDDVYETERQLLYVACTRARDRLLVTGVQPVSEFMDDMESGSRRVADGSQA